MKPIVALVSEDSDLNLHLLQHVLRHKRIPFIEINPTVLDRNFDFTLIAERNENARGEAIFDGRKNRHSLSNIRAIWNRGAAYFGGGTTRPGSSRNLVHYESIYAYEYLWWLLRNCVWVNPILDSRAAHNRLIQCRVAADCGMNVPNQVVTTLEDNLAQFARLKEKTIIKTISQGGLRETGPKQIKTEYFKNMDARANVADRLSAPVLLQEYIEKDYELRAVVVGEKVYAAAIDSARSETTALDSRLWQQAGLTYYRVKLEESVNDTLVTINKKLGLAYSSIDLVRAKNGELYFLEANPAGQWSYIEMLTGFPITEEIANLLVAAT